jgi:hypothetical protein
MDQHGFIAFEAPYLKLFYFSARKVVSLALLLSSAKPFLLGLNPARKEANQTPGSHAVVLVNMYSHNIP